MELRIAESDPEIMECWAVMSQLRPHLVKDGFLSVVRQQMEQGYRIAFIKSQAGVAAVAGFRILQNLAWGKFCYVDDLVSLESERSKGYGAELMRWLLEFAQQKGCQRLELDSGVQRHGAHRFYLRHRMWISCYHFSLNLQPLRQT